MRQKTIIVEEHHEAFGAWSASLGNGSGQPRLLIHVDEHSDLDIPRFDQPVKEVVRGAKSLEDFVYNKLSIANFITPAVYLGLFDEICWVQADCPDLRTVDGYVGSHKSAGCALEASEQPLHTPDCRPYRFTHQSLGAPLPSRDEWVLDIDLDFFSSAEARETNGRVEITAEEYQRISTDRYHFLRLIWGSVMTLQQSDGRYFLHYNKFENEHSSHLRNSEAAIRARVELLRRALQRVSTPPRLITICRSRFSGFTPHSQWEYIESRLLGSLATLYELEVVSIDEFDWR